MWFSNDDGDLGIIPKVVIFMIVCGIFKTIGNEPQENVNQNTNEIIIEDNENEAYETMEIDIENNSISYKNAEDINIIKIINNKTNNSKYYMVKEKHSRNTSTYELTDILTNIPILKINENKEIIENNDIINYENLGSLSDYLLTSDSYKTEYTKEELETFLDTLVKETFNTKNKELAK